MVNALRISMILAVVVLFFSGCSVEKVKTQGQIDWLVSEEQVKNIELKIVWQNKFPFDETDQLKQLEVVGGRIYGFSRSNYLVGLNRENGSAVFIRNVAPPGLPIYGLAEYGGMLYSVVGNQLVELNPDSGAEISSERLNFSGTCAPAARNSSHYFIAGRDKRLHALRADDKVQIYEVAAQSDTEITSIVVTCEDLPVFSSKVGEVVCISSDGRNVRWQFQAGGGIVGKLAWDKDSLYFASDDTKVYKISSDKGKLLWMYRTEGIPDRGPRVTKQVVYQYVRGKGLVAIDKNTGDEIWILTNGIDLLAEDEDKAYILADGGQVILMDNSKGKQLGAVTIDGASMYAVNSTDSKIYVADGEGRIACLMPKY